MKIWKLKKVSEIQASLITDKPACLPCPACPGSARAWRAPPGPRPSTGWTPGTGSWRPRPAARRYTAPACPHGARSWTWQHNPSSETDTETDETVQKMTRLQHLEEAVGQSAVPAPYLRDPGLQHLLQQHHAAAAVVHLAGQAGAALAGRAAGAAHVTAQAGTCLVPRTGARHADDDKLRLW